MPIRYFFPLLVFSSGVVAQYPRFEISAGKYDRNNMPVFVSMKKPLSRNITYQLVNEKTKKIYPLQLVDSITVLFIYADSLPSGAKQILRIQPVKKTFRAGMIRIEEGESGLLAKVNDKPVFLYHTKVVMPPPDSPVYYQRSGFIHPLYSPGGKILTDNFPSSHAHQHGIFMAWTNTTFKKEFVDFWNHHLQKGTVEHLELAKVSTGPVFAQIKTRLSHRSLTHGEILQENWTITIYPFSNYFLFDLISEQHNVTTDTVFLNKYHYGGMALRGSRVWDPQNKNHFQNNWSILTSEGIRDSAANHTHTRWVDASGMIDGETNGVTVYTHPSNFRYPQAIRVHPTMPYWVYSPVVDDAFHLLPGSVYRSRYRYYVHNGPPDLNMIEKIRRDCEEPVVVRISNDE